MFGKIPRVNPLVLRKQLLLAESELNRALALGDLAGITVGVRALLNRAKSFGSLSSTLAVVIAGFEAFQRGKPAEADAKPSWLKRIFKGAGLISTLWLALRPQGCDRKNQ